MTDDRPQTPTSLQTTHWAVLADAAGRIPFQSREQTRSSRSRALPDTVQQTMQRDEPETKPAITTP